MIQIVPLVTIQNMLVTPIKILLATAKSKKVKDGYDCFREIDMMSGENFAIYFWD
jgi:hypothetical protein